MRPSHRKEDAGVYPSAICEEYPPSIIYFFFAGAFFLAGAFFTGADVLAGAFGAAFFFAGAFFVAGAFFGFPANFAQVSSQTNPRGTIALLS